MRIALIADTFPPSRSSGAVQMRDLARELVRQGHAVTVLTPAPDQTERWTIAIEHGVEVVRLKAMQARDRSYLVRTLGELAMPWLMLRNFRASPAATHRFDGVAWYSPSIFFGPLVKALKREHRCPAYLIIRDIFPQWAADMGLMRRGPAFRVLDRIAQGQYDAADVIGVQTEGNRPFLAARTRQDQRIEVLHNWLAPAADVGCSIDLSASPIAGRTTLVYAGNMGVAQDMGTLIDAATHLRDDREIGFAFVGRGSEAAALRQTAAERGLTNVVFFDEIDPDEIAGLYAQCDIGLVALDPRHVTHNIPGKFISYMHAGLPVLATINPGNDLKRLIEDERVGRVSTAADGAKLADLARGLVAEIRADPPTGRCRALAARMFSSHAAAAQVVDGLSKR